MRLKILDVLFWAAWFVVALFIVSSPAYAWGPGAHIETSRWLLANLFLLAPGIRAIISAHPFAFIYGSVIPDMVLGKRFMRPEENNHNWEVGFKIRDCAGTTRQKAFALGYLSHLAADTIAHNHFIPDRLLAQFSRRRRGHMVQELLFDAMIDEEVWNLARRACRRPFGECDLLLGEHLGRTPLPRRLNHRLFRSGMVLVRLGGWKRVNKRIRRRWGKEIDPSTMEPYLRAIRETVLDFLNFPESAACLQHNPTGGAVLPEAERLRSLLKGLDRREGLTPEEYDWVVALFQEWRETAQEASPAVVGHV